MSKIAWKGNGDILLASIKHRSIVFFTRRITFGRKESGTRAIVVEIFARDRLANQFGMPPTWLTGSESTLGTESRPTLVGDAMSQRRLLRGFAPAEGNGAGEKTKSAGGQHPAWFFRDNEWRMVCGESRSVSSCSALDTRSRPTVDIHRSVTPHRRTGSVFFTKSHARFRSFCPGK